MTFPEVLTALAESEINGIPHNLTYEDLKKARIKLETTLGNLYRLTPMPSESCHPGQTAL